MVVFSWWLTCWSLSSGIVCDVNGNRRIEPSVEWAGVYERDINSQKRLRFALDCLADQDTFLLNSNKLHQVVKIFCSEIFKICALRFFPSKKT